MKDDASWGDMTRGAGTSLWMAPEVMQGTAYDEKADVYSYAICLFEIICRNLPFEEAEEDPGKVLQLIVGGARPALAAVPPTCPEELRETMVACWAHIPDGRPAFSDILRRLRGV